MVSLPRTGDKTDPTNPNQAQSRSFAEGTLKSTGQARSHSFTFAGFHSGSAAKTLKTAIAKRNPTETEAVRIIRVVELYVTQERCAGRVLRK